MPSRELEPQASPQARATQGEKTMTKHDEYKGKCDHCAETMSPADCGTAEVEAIWRDTDGSSSGARSWICRKCLDSGTKGGPGYEAVESQDQ